MLYVTELAVFRLLAAGARGGGATAGSGQGQDQGQGGAGSCLQLIEVAPGVDLEREVLSLMDFRPLVREVKLMDAAIFQ